MSVRRHTVLALLGLAVGCGGSGKGASSVDAENLTLEDVVAQTQEACEQIRSCDLINDTDEAQADCQELGLNAVDNGTRACVQAYYVYESCVADAGCSDLEGLFKSSDQDAECRSMGNAVEKKCNVNVF
jgi:hypothetical protein